MAETEVLIDLILTDSRNEAGNKAFLPPYGLALLAAQMPEKVFGCPVNLYVHDMYCSGPYSVSYRQPDVVMISSLTSGIPHAYAIADEALRTRSHVGKPIKSIIGGIHATVLPLEALQHCNLVVRGEMPLSFQRFAIEHVMVMEEGGREAWRLGELPSEIVRPKINWDVIDRRKYCLKLGLLTAFGCSMDCDFCSVTNIYGSAVRLVDIKSLEEEIAYFPSGWVMIYDDNLLPNAGVEAIKRTMEMARLLHQFGHCWAGEVTLKTLHRAIEVAKRELGIDLLEFLYEHGCRGLLFGIETLSGVFKKSVEIQISTELIKRCRKIGIIVIGAFIIGADPNETPEDGKRLLDFAVSELDLMIATIMTPMPGSLNFINAVHDGTLLHRGWEYYKGYNACFRHLRMSPEELEIALLDFAKGFYSIKSVTERSFLPLLYSMSAWKRYFSPVANLGGLKATKNWDRVFQNREPIVQKPLDQIISYQVGQAIAENPFRPRLFDVRNPNDGLSKLFFE